MTVYYMQDGLANYAQTSKVTAFRPGFRQLVGEASYRTKEQARRFRQITYTCLDTMSTRYPETLNLPDRPCAAGIMANVRFPTCWDGKNLDSPDHMGMSETSCFLRTLLFPVETSRNTRIEVDS
jgi:hypothetical protein